MKANTRVFIFIIGVVLSIIAFVGFIAFATTFSPPPVRILVYTRDLNFGDTVSREDLAVVEVANLPSVLVQLYAKPEDAEDVVGKQLLEGVKRGEPVFLAKLATPKNFTRYAALLTDTTKIIMTLAIPQDRIPSKIVIGDKVNLIVVADREFDVVVTPSPTPQGIVFETPTPLPEGAEATPTPTPTPAVLFPIVDLVLQNIPVIDIQRELVENPNFGREGDDRRYIEGPVKAIVVLIPREYQQVIVLAQAMNKLYVTLASPYNESFTEAIPYRPLSYDEYGKLVRFKQNEALRRGDYITHELYLRYFEAFYPPDHQSIVATREAWLNREEVDQEKAESLKYLILKQTPTPPVRP